MLVNASEMLKKAVAGHYAVGQFNINNLEWTKSVLLTAEEMKAPVILGVSEGAGKYMTGFTTVAAMVAAMDKALGITVPVALHLDHGTYEGAKALSLIHIFFHQCAGRLWGREAHWGPQRAHSPAARRFLPAWGNRCGKRPKN